MKMLIAMTMMMFMQVAATEEFNVEDYGEAVPQRDEFVSWELTMTTATDLVDITRTFHSWDQCVRFGIEWMTRNLEVSNQDDNPYRWTGFICGDGETS